MGEYRRLISYIYSYEKGIKNRNSGFAKVESRNGVCKVNISLRISDILLNETEDNMLEVFLFTRQRRKADEASQENDIEQKIEKLPIGRIRIVSGGSLFKTRINAERICDTSVSLDEISGIFICSKAFLHRKSKLNVIYASEWDDIPIQTELFTEDSEEEEAEDNFIGEEKKALELKASEVSMEDMTNKTISEAAISDDSVSDVRMSAGNIGSENGITDAAISDTSMLDDRGTDNTMPDRMMSDNSILEQSGCGCMKKNQNQEESASSCRQQLERLFSQAPARQEDYFETLCRCYPKMKVDEIDGECVKITPHDISYLPKRYWHLCNNSFLLHGYYSYKYLLLCKKNTVEDSYMICVPGMFHNKEQVMAQMFGFDMFECGGAERETMRFGYWCMNL